MSDISPIQPSNQDEEKQQVLDTSQNPKNFVALACLAALISSVPAWAGGEMTLGLFQPSKEAAGQPYAFQKLNEEKDIADGRNAAVAYGMLGAAVGLVLGLIGGRTRASGRGAFIGGLCGVVLGGLVPALVAPWVVPLHRKNYWPETPDLMLPIMVHSAIWCPLGAAVGFAFAIGLGDKRRYAQAVLGGMIGGLLATVAFDAIGAIAFAHSRADLPIGDTLELRLMSRIIVSVGVALGVLMSVQERKPKSVKA